MRMLLRLIGMLLLSGAMIGGASAQKILKVNESLGPGSVEEAALLQFKKIVEEGEGPAADRDSSAGCAGQAGHGVGVADGRQPRLYSGALEYYAQIVPQELNAISIPYFIGDPGNVAQVPEESDIQRRREEAAGSRHPRHLDRVQRRPRDRTGCCSPRSRCASDQQQLLVRAANEAGKFYAKTTLDRVQGDIDFMKSANKAEFIPVDANAWRKKLEPFYESLVKDKLLSQEIYDTVKTLR
ncbi:MAG: hypothetical protein IPI73_21560 [Betaproteobacteria bacterium]|nr:hypothetical protein [Betaproteobacteria bacterium]